MPPVEEVLETVLKLGSDRSKTLHWDRLVVADVEGIAASSLHFVSNKLSS